MEGQQFERMIGRLMKQDFSAGTEKFREELLARCLDALDADDDEECMEVSDSDLDMLAAAGVPYAPNPNGIKLSTPYGY